MRYIISTRAKISRERERERDSQAEANSSSGRLVASAPVIRFSISTVLRATHLPAVSLTSEDPSGSPTQQPYAHHHWIFFLSTRARPVIFRSSMVARSFRVPLRWSSRDWIYHDDRAVLSRYLHISTLRRRLPARYLFQHRSRNADYAVCFTGLLRFYFFFFVSDTKKCLYLDP